MKKKNFYMLLVTVLGGLMFAIGMCMCLLPEWNAFKPGVVVTALGAVILIVMAVMYRRASGKPAAKPNWKLIGKIAYGAFGALVLGVGMALIMVGERFMLGMVIGVVGILLLIGLIPVIKGLK